MSQEERKSDIKTGRMAKSGLMGRGKLGKLELLALVQQIDNRLDKEKPKLVKLENQLIEQKKVVADLRKLRGQAARRINK